MVQIAYIYTHHKNDFIDNYLQTKVQANATPVLI